MLSQQMSTQYGLRINIADKVKRHVKYHIRVLPSELFARRRLGEVRFDLTPYPPRR